ncbi:hypothetical protein [Xanthomonas phage RTH11]|nr:hypothetical protein [Xanthomonas phage RTH11]
MLPIIAIFRVDEDAFMFYDLDKEKFIGKFTVPAGDEYHTMTYGSLTFAEYDEENEKSIQLISVTVSNKSDGQERVLKDLPTAELVETILHIFTDLNLDKRSEGQVSVVKH